MYQLKYLEGEYLTLYNEIFLKISNVYLRMMTARESNVSLYFYH